MCHVHVHDSVAVRMRVKEKQRMMQIFWGEDLVGFCASPVVAARATPVRQAPSQVDFTKSAKKSAEKIRPDLLQMWGINLSGHLKIFHRHFSKNASHCPKFAQKKVFVHREALQG